MPYLVIVYSMSMDEPLDVTGQTRPKTERTYHFLKSSYKEAVKSGREERERLNKEENRNAWIQIRGPRGGIYWL